MQEIGRAGRDCQQSQAILFYNASDTGSNRKNLKPEMKDYCTTASCRREFICKFFGYEVPNIESDKLHYCCDVCEKLCECDDCSQILADLVADCGINKVQERTAQLTVKDRQSPHNSDMLYGALSAYFSMENKSNEGSMHTGLTPSILTTIVSEFDRFQNVSELQHRFPNLSMTFLKNIFSIIMTISNSVDDKAKKKN